MMEFRNKMNDLLNQSGLKNVIFLFICFMLQPINSYALYENCIFSWEFGDTQREVLVVSPVGSICSQRCSNECQSFSRIGFDGELNQDIIDQCTMVCQSGQIFSSQYREANPDSTAWYPYVWKPSVSTMTSCSSSPTSNASAYNNYFDTGLQVSPGTEAVITVYISPNSTGNVIHMCGMKTVKVFPTLYSFVDNTWSANTELWRNAGTSITTWNARNPNWTDTGIDVKDGDSLSITMGWGYVRGGGCPCSYNTPKEYSLYIRKPYNDSWNDGGKLYLAGTELKVAGSNDTGGYSISPAQAAANNAKYTFLGLSNTIFRNTRSNVLIDGTMIDYYKYNLIYYSGNLSGFSPYWSRLGILHVDGGDRSNWDDNVGGQYVQIMWRGCSYYNGDRLQYAIAPPSSSNANTYDPKDPRVEWHDISLVDIQNGNNVTLQGAQAGELYLRIKPLSFETAAAPNCPNDESICKSSNANVRSNYGAPATSGQYYVSVQVVGNPALISNFVADIINTVHGYLFGSSSGAGKVQTIFNNTLINSDLISAIRALLVLYIAYTGLSFIAGIAHITQRDAVIRFVKIGVVLALIAPNSWGFFYTYLFSLFTDGSLELIAKVSSATNSSTEQIAQIEQDPSLIFSVFDKPFTILFSKEVWIKICAMLLSSFLGFFLAIFIIFAVITYAFCIGKAIIMYLISMMGVAILLLIAPLFISFILFEYTRQFFDAWLKQLLSFALQPVFIFGIIAMLNNLMLIALYTTLGYTACSVCFLGFDLGSIANICLIPGWTTLIDMHYPADDFLGMPLTQVGAVLFFLLMVQSTYVLMDYCSKVAMQITSGGFIGTNLADMLDRNDPVEKVVGGIGAVTGTDKASTTARKGIITPFEQGYAQNKQKKEEKLLGKTSDGGDKKGTT